MDDLGLEDGDDALQYALMLSMDDREVDNEQYPPAIGADVDAHEIVVGDEADDTELREMLEMIRVSEEREKERERSDGST